MNTLAFSRLLARHLTVDDAATLTGEAALDILAAINAGLSEFYREAPSRLKKVAFSRTLRAPQNVDLEMQEKYGRTLSSGTFDAARIGCTVSFPHLAFDTEVASVSQIHDDYLSDTLTATVRVFGDAIPLLAPIEKMTSDVICIGAGQTSVLCRDEGLNTKRLNHQEGTPRYYKLESRSVSQAAEPAFLLRVWPLPSVDFIIRFEAECGPFRIGFPTLVNPIELPIEDSYAEDILLPLCEAQLVTSSLWRDQKTKSSIADRAQMVLRTKIPMLSHDSGIPDNVVMTPGGF